MKKKLIAILVCMTMCVWLLPTCSFAGEIADSGNEDAVKVEKAVKTVKAKKVSQAENEWTLVEDLFINEKTVYSDKTGKLAFDKKGTKVIKGLMWDDQDDYDFLTMINANLKSIQYKNSNKLIVELGGENTIASDIKPTPIYPEDPESLTKNPAFDVQNAEIRGEGDLDVSMLVDCERPKHYVMEAQTLELSKYFTGELNVNHRDLFGPSMAIEKLYVYGGRLFTNSEIDAFNMVVDGGEIEINVEKYASCGICTSLEDPKSMSGTFKMKNGYLKIVNHQDVFPEEGLARGIWSAKDIILDGGLVELYCDEEAIFNESNDGQAGFVLNGGHLTAVSDETVAVRAESFDINSGDADLTGKEASIFIDNEPTIDGSMKIIEPANGSFKINQYGHDSYTVVDEDNEPARRAVIASKDHNVSFSGNGGMWGENPVKIVSAKYFEEDGNYHIDIYSLPAPYLKGYMVGGWTDRDGGVFTFGDDGTIIPAGGFSACSEWMPIYYMVSFDANGGSGDMDNQFFTYDVAQRLSKNTFTKKGFSFAGWKNLKTGKMYGDKESVKNLSNKHDECLTFQAQWKPLPLVLVKAASKSKTVKLSWNKIKGAKKYVVYGKEFGKNYKKLKTTAKNSYKVTKINGKKLKSHKVYKFYVQTVTSGEKVKSKAISFIVGKTMGKYANARKISVNQKALTLKPGKTAKLKVKTVIYKNKKHLGKRYGAATRFISNNPAVAKVNAAGVITAKKKGKAIIYIQDIGGRYCKTSVTCH